MEIGKRIKELRVSKNMTQEDLAFKLGVSTQAVSRWETNITYPDITLLPILANIFDVTVDYLLDVDMMKKQQEIDDIHDQDMKLFNEGKIEERLKLIEGAIKKYPNSWSLKGTLMNIYFTISYNLEDYNNEYVDKTINLGNEILDKCTDDDTRYLAIQELVFCYRRKNELDNAKKIVDKLLDMIISKDFLYPDVVKGVERIKATQRIFESLAEMFYGKLITTYGREEVGKRDIVLLKGIKMFELVYEKEDYGFYNERISDLYMRCAKDQAKIKNAPKTIKYLKLSLKYLDEFIKIYNDKEVIKHTSFLVDRLEDDSSKWSFSSEFNYYNEFKNDLEIDIFDFIRDDEEFKELIK